MTVYPRTRLLQNLLDISQKRKRRRLGARGRETLPLPAMARRHWLGRLGLILAFSVLFIWIIGLIVYYQGDF